MSALHYSPLLPTLWLLPLFGAVALWAFGPQLRRNAGYVGSAFVLASFACALGLFGEATLPGNPVRVPLIGWAPGFDFGLSLDPLSLLWTLIITGVGGLIHVYSIGYMWNDRAIARFFAYMNFFVFSMLTLVLSDNVVGLLVGWGLVGLASVLSDRFLVLQAVGRRRRPQGVRDQRLRRHRHHVRDLRAVRDDGFDRVRGHLRKDRLVRARLRAAGLRGALRRRARPNRRRFRCTPGCPTRWKARPPCQR